MDAQGHQQTPQDQGTGQHNTPTTADPDDTPCAGPDTSQHGGPGGGAGRHGGGAAQNGARRQLATAEIKF